MTTPTTQKTDTTEKAARAYRRRMMDALFGDEENYFGPDTLTPQRQRIAELEAEVARLREMVDERNELVAALEAHLLAAQAITIQEELDRR